MASSAVLASRRSYFWPYQVDMVPEDGKPSSFQASPVPSVTESIVREYALGPLFGARTPLCMLGFFSPAKDPSPYDGKGGRALAAELIGKKEALRVALAELLSCDKGEVALGPITLAKEMMLYRANTPESPRLADGPGACGPYPQRRRTRYARKPIAARAFLDVYVPDGMFESAVERHHYACFIQDRIAHHTAESVSFDGTRSAYDGQRADVPKAKEMETALSGERQQGRLSAQQRAAFESDMEERARVLDSVADLLELGVVYCEVPVREEDVVGHDYTFDTLHGKQIDLATAEQVLDRWDARLRV